MQTHSFSYIHDDVIKWKHFPRYWPFVRGIHRWPVNSPHKGQWRGALMFSLICAWINRWVNNREADDLRRHRAHYDVMPGDDLAILRTKPLTAHDGDNHDLFNPKWFVPLTTGVKLFRYYCIASNVKRKPYIYIAILFTLHITPQSVAGTLGSVNSINNSGGLEVKHVFYHKGRVQTLNNSKNI